MNFLLNADINNSTLSESPSEILGLGGQVVLIGMLTVFAVLGLLWAFLTVFKMVFYNSSSKKSKKVVAEKEVIESVVAPAPVYSQDEEIVAVIAAAIAAAESESAEGLKFRVVSFRRR